MRYFRKTFDATNAESALVQIACDDAYELFINGRRVLAIAEIPYPMLKNLVQFEIDHAGR